MIRPHAPTAAAALVACALFAPSAVRPAAAEEPAPGVVPIVAQSIAFHGGDLYDHADIAFTIVSKSGAFDAEVHQDGGMYRYAVTSETEAGRRTVIATNDDVTVLLDGVAQPVPADRVQRLRDFVSARIYFPLLPYRLADPSVRQEDLGIERWPTVDDEGGPGDGERRLHKVKVTFAAGSSTDAHDEYLYWFDPETGRLEQLAYSYTGGVRFRRAFNFRRVGGILFSDQQNVGIDWEDEADAVSVDAITPELVSSAMRQVSTVRIEDLSVQPIGR
jgi:hypothetical protein